MANKPNKIVRSWVPQRTAFSRENDNSKFYNSWPWRKKSKAHRMAHPLCVKCEEKGETVAGKVVDHIKSINTGGEKLDDNNLQTLCERCHNRKSSAESRGMG
jgi:5-methylcytosine-specific restriction endonuclease McrA